MSNQSATMNPYTSRLMRVPLEIFDAILQYLDPVDKSCFILTCHTVAHKAPYMKNWIEEIKHDEDYREALLHR